MNKNFTRVLKNDKNELLTLPSLEFDQTNTMVSVSNLETPVNDIYVSSIELPTLVVCKNMLLPWITQNISDEILTKLIAKITSFMGVINNQHFLNTWKKTHGEHFQDGIRIEVNVTEQEAIITPRTFFPRTRLGKQIAQRRNNQRSLKDDILNNIIKITHQEIISSRQEIKKIQLG